MKESERKAKLEKTLEAISERVLMKEIAEVDEGADAYVVIRNLYELKKCAELYERQLSEEDEVGCIGLPINPMLGKLNQNNFGYIIKIYLDKYEREVTIPESTRRMVYNLNPRARKNFDVSIKMFMSLYKEIIFK